MNHTEVDGEKTGSGEHPEQPIHILAPKSEVCSLEVANALPHRAMAVCGKTTSHPSWKVNVEGLPANLR
jgi:hypothetical protein